MSLNQYLIDLLMKERAIVEELLMIDNKIQFTNLTYDKLLNDIRGMTIHIKDIPIRKYDFITDGELQTILQCLINYAPLINHLNINKRYVGVNTWLVKHINDYYREQSLNINISLDISDSYSLYDDSKAIVICGFKEFIEGTSLLFDNKNIIEVEM